MNFWQSGKPGAPSVVCHGGMAEGEMGKCRLGPVLLCDMGKVHPCEELRSPGTNFADRSAEETDFRATE